MNLHREEKMEKEKKKGGKTVCLVVAGTMLYLQKNELGTSVDDKICCICLSIKLLTASYQQIFPLLLLSVFDGITFFFFRYLILRAYQ